MNREYLIQRYEHNYFRGWVVSTKRRGKRTITGAGVGGPVLTSC
jgi:hypothetical protein